MKIIHTNDIHSSFEQFSRIGTLLQKYPKESRILVDGGDFADFKNISLQGTNGKMACELLEIAEYDAWAVGNNEIFNGIETLRYMAQNSAVPMLSANIRNLEGNRIEGIQEGILLERGNRRFLLIGLSPNLEPFNALCGVSIIDSKEAIQNVLKKYQGQYDHVIWVTHIGRQEDLKLLDEIKNVDFIISGHSHILDEEIQYYKGIPMHMSGNYGEYLGMVDWDFDVQKEIESAQISTKEVEVHSEIVDILEEGKKKATLYLEKNIGTLSSNLWHDVVEENPMTNFTADSLRIYAKVPFAIINSGVINGGMKKGQVTEKKILELSPSPLNVTVFEVQAKNVKEAIVKSLDPEHCLLDGKGPGFRGKYIGRLHFSGFTVHQNEFRELTLIDESGLEIKENTWMKIASSDYLQRGSGYPTMGENRNPVYHKPYIRDIVRQFFENEKIIQKSQNWRFISWKR